MSHPNTVVVALGGNAILRRGEKGTAAEQQRNVDVAAAQLARMVEAGYPIVVTHGNGPQVGNILLQQQAAAPAVPSMPLDVCGAQSQGMLGLWLVQGISRYLPDRPVAAVLTRTLVDPADPAFAFPTKPIGPFYDEAHAREAMARSEAWVNDAGRGWRRVVPSPRPKGTIEAPAIEALLKAGVIVVASGGGGVPVVRGADGRLQAVEAVIDKDLAAARLAVELKASTLLILTDVPQVALNWGRPEQHFVSRLGMGEAEALLAGGHFHAGSMGPKVEAAVQFARSGGVSIIASLEEAMEALEGRAGTRIARELELAGNRAP